MARRGIFGFFSGFLIDEHDRSTFNALIQTSTILAAHYPPVASPSGHGFRQEVSRYAEGTLPVITPLVGLIPIAGPFLSAAFGSGLEILKLFEVRPIQLSIPRMPRRRAQQPKSSNTIRITKIPRFL